MTAERSIMGTVRGGMIVPKTNTGLSEGMEVEIVLPTVSASLVHRMEPTIWQQARRESEALLAKWEREPKDENGWPRSFFEDTYGSLASNPLVRLPQGELEEREEID